MEELETKKYAGIDLGRTSVQFSIYREGQEEMTEVSFLLSEEEQKEYIDTAVSMMEKAQKRFLEMREEPKYTAGIAKSVIGDIMSSDKNFMETTQRLFAKTIYHNAKKNIF